MRRLITISFIVLIFFPIAQASSEKARDSAAKAQIATFDTALDMYETDMGDYPSTTESLAMLNFNPPHPPKTWNGPYLKTAVPLDPWGNPYSYLSPGIHNTRTYDIASAGHDGRFGTSDDIANYPTDSLPDSVMDRSWRLEWPVILFLAIMTPIIVIAFIFIIKLIDKMSRGAPE